MPFGRRLWLSFSLLAAVNLPVSAAQLPQPDEEELKLDSAIGALKDEILQFSRDANLTEREVLYPPATRTSVYVSTRVNQLLIREISISLDEQAPVNYRYSEKEATALHNSEGLHRVILTNLEPGAHRIRAQFSGRYQDDSPEEPPVTGSYEGVFNKTTKEAFIELAFARPSRLRKPDVSLKNWSLKGFVDEQATSPNSEVNRLTRNRRRLGR